MNIDEVKHQLIIVYQRIRLLFNQKSSFPTKIDSLKKKFPPPEMIVLTKEYLFSVVQNLSV